MRIGDQPPPPPVPIKKNIFVRLYCVLEAHLALGLVLDLDLVFRFSVRLSVSLVLAKC